MPPPPPGPADTRPETPSAAALANEAPFAAAPSDADGPAGPADAAAAAGPGAAPAASGAAPPAPPAAAMLPGAPRSPIPWPARQVAPFAVALALGQDGAVRLVLTPAELGRVEVAIARRGAAATVSITAERPETLALLLRDRAELERALAGAGLGEATSLAFGAGGAAPGGDGAGRHGARQDRPAEGGARRAAPAGAGRLPAAAPAPAPAPGRGLLDLAI